MDCASCGRAHPASARFCGGCGASLAPRCPACGTEAADDARFCTACGAALAARPTAVSRKVVTVVFADLVGSVALHERLDAESARRFMDRYHRAMSAAVAVHGGRVVQLLGDGVLAAFGVPRVAEDDAIRAVRAGAGMQRAFRELMREQRALPGVGLRVAVNTGEIVVGDDENSVMGDPTNVAARLQQEARDGDVLLGQGTQRLVADLVTLAPLGSFALKGRSETVAAWRLVSLDRPASARATAFVGRDDELRRLLAVYETAVGAPGPRLAVLLGSPGLGKSRLVAELVHRASERATVLAARCDAAGGATFAPLAEALRSLLRLDDGTADDALRAAIDAIVPGEDAERTRIATGIGALLTGAPASSEETFFVVRRLLGALAVVRPVVLVVDDLHWAEPLLLDLLEHLVQWSPGVPLYLLVAARPELRDVRASLTAPGPLVAEVVTLAGLDAGAATRLAANVLGGSDLPAALAGRVLATSEGNPLFVGELVRMLVQDGTLRREGGRWLPTVELAKLDMPPTIQVLLAARIERLRPEERSVLERAAVIGRQFSRAAVAELLPLGALDLDARLEALRRSELIESDTGWYLGEPALRFHHVLIRDAAYRRVLKETRAELHERLADWIGARAGDAVEHDETIGWHLEQAHQNLRELAPLDAHGASLGARAARHLGVAARRALARDDLPLAAGLLGRAIDRLDAEDPARADLALDWCEALLSGGEVAAAARAIDELGRLAGREGRLRAWHTCFAGQLAALTDPQSLRATVEAVSGAAQSLAAAGDPAGEAKAHAVHAGALARLGEVGACEAALDRALAAARKARDRRRANAVLAGAPAAALWGPSPVTRASGRCLDVVRVLRITQGAPAVEAVALRCQAVLEALRGRTEAARRMITASRRMVEELGIAQQLLEADVFAGLIELLEGDAAAAEACLRGAYEGLRERGLAIDAARAAALLGRALLAQHRAGDAEALSRESEALAGDDLKAAIAWRGVRAEALARRGEHAAAVELASAAVGIAAATDALLDHADARVALAVALQAAGRGAEADAESRRAVELWEAKGASLLVERSQGDALPRPSGPSQAETKRLHGTRRLVRPNAATANAARMDAAFAARDLDAFLATLAPAARAIHHPTGAVYDEHDSLPQYRLLFANATARFEHVPLASLGDSLALCHGHVSIGAGALDGHAVGSADMSSILLLEVDSDGRRKHTEFFAPEQLTRAITGLYARWGELQPDPRARNAVAKTVRALGVVFTFDPSSDLDEVLVEEPTFLDHRLLGMPSGSDRETHHAGRGSLVGSADELALHLDEILALEPGALLFRSTTTGRDRNSGGRFERPIVQIRIFAADGRIQRTEWFDVEREADALVRFRELTSGARAATGVALEAAHAPPPRGVPANAATTNAAWRAQLAANAAWSEHRWDAVIASIAPGIRMVDRRALVGLDVAGEQFLANVRFLFDAPESRWRSELLATRGERLILVRAHFSARPGGGPIEAEQLSVIERDAEGRSVALVVFDPPDRDSAYAELDARYHAGEAAAHAEAAAAMRAFHRAFAARDWDALAAQCAPDIAVHDHRRLGWEPLDGVAAYLDALRALVELAPDTRLRLDHVELDARRYLVTTVWEGTREGGHFEEPSWMVAELDAQGRVRRFDQYDLGRLDAARARFEALGAEPGADPLRIPPNAATRASDRLQQRHEALDWDGMAALCAPTMVFDDRRRGSLTGGDRDTFFASARFVSSQQGRVTATLLATAGDRLALRHLHFGAATTSDAPIEAEALSLIEVDAEGRITAMVAFDADDRRAASLEMVLRFSRTGEVPAGFAGGPIALRGLIERDLEPLRASLADAFVLEDHRRTGLGRIEGADAFLRSFAAMVEQSGDLLLEGLYTIAISERGLLEMAHTFGTLAASGGAFEIVYVRLLVFGGDRLIRLELFEPEELERARARFEALPDAG